MAVVYLLLTIVSVGAGALAIVQGHGPLGMLFVFLGLIAAGIVGNEHGRKSGLSRDFRDLPEDEEYVFHGSVQLQFTEMAIILRSDYEHKVTVAKQLKNFITVRHFHGRLQEDKFNLKEGDVFMRKGERIFVKK